MFVKVAENTRLVKILQLAQKLKHVPGSFFNLPHFLHLSDPASS